VQNLAPAEREQLPRERRGAIGRAADLLKVGVQRAAGDELVGDQHAIALDGGQQIVEIVRDAARELADGLHLLGLAILFLEQASLGDVESDAGRTYRPPR